MHKIDTGLARVLLHIATLQLYGFQVSIERDIGQLFRVTVYRFVRTGRETAKLVVFTALADFPVAYPNIANELEKICEHFLSREDIRHSQEWITDTELTALARLLSETATDIPAKIAEKELERIR